MTPSENHTERGGIVSNRPVVRPAKIFESLRSFEFYMLLERRPNSSDLGLKGFRLVDNALLMSTRKYICNCSLHCIVPTEVGRSTYKHASY
jgi:hypothetical protein